MNIEEANLDDADRIFLDISMELYEEFNETLCNINAHLGDIYSYKDLEDVEKAQSEKEIKLLRQAIESQQFKIDKQEKIINAMAEDIYETGAIFNYVLADNTKTIIKHYEKNLKNKRKKN